MGRHMAKYRFSVLMAALLISPHMFAASSLSDFLGTSARTDVDNRADSMSTSAQSNTQSQPLLESSATTQPVIAPKMFGEQLFRGAFASTVGSTFNTNYLINPGDNILVRMWGAYQFSGNLTVDPKGNIFIPNVGPIKVSGVNNGQLQKIIEQNVRRVYRENVGVYTALETAQPIKVFVTGFVTQPGYYGGVSTDSILSYLDRAGGVDVSRGSYVDVEIRRQGQLMQSVNLYDFILAGNLTPFSFRDGDVVVVTPRKRSFKISGEVYNSYEFEFDVQDLTVARALSVARVKPSATHVSIQRRQGTEYRSEYYPIAAAGQVKLHDGDVLNVTADRFAGTIQVRIEGAHAGEHAMVLPYGATLDQVVKTLKPNALTNLSGIQLFRKSVATKQKEMLDISLNKLEEATYSVRSATTEEASLRVKDAELIKQFVAKARAITPKGQVIVQKDHWDKIILEEGDIIQIPEKTSVILLHGEVMFPNAVTWRPDLSAKDYIELVGGFTQSSDKSKIIVIKQNGEAARVSGHYKIQQGEEIMVLPKVSTKYVEVTRGVSQILYQLAIAAKVVLDL
jgi:protein involved in polysaccharide export with SLBB domain